MSSRSQLVADAIFSKSNVAAVVGSGKLSALYESVAPATATFPYGVYFRIAPEPREYAFGTSGAATEVLQGDLWQFKVISKASSTLSAGKVAENLLAVWISTLGTTLTLSGATVAWMEPFADMPPYQEQLNEVFIFHRGTQMRIVTSA